MKKIELCFVMIILVIVAVLFSGCEEQLASPQELLIKLPSDWAEKYGDGLESRQTGNIVLAIQVINNQGKAIKQLNSRLVVLEDPNGLKARVSALETNAIMDRDEIEVRKEIIPQLIDEDENRLQWVNLPSYRNVIYKVDPNE